MNPSPIKPSVRIALGPTASAALAATDCPYYVVTRQYHPHDPSRWAISCYALPDEVAQQIAAILAGTHHAIRNRPAKAAQAIGACHPSISVFDAPQAILTQ